MSDEPASSCQETKSGYKKEPNSFRKKSKKYLLHSRLMAMGLPAAAKKRNQDMTKCHSIRHQTPKFPTPPKVMQQFFLGYSGPYFGPTNTNHTKNHQKITFGALFF